MKKNAAIGEAVGGKLIENAAVSTTGLNQTALLERAFAFAFRGLVYAQIWEDPVADMAGLEIAEGHHVVTIASGGCNALSYLTAGPAHITAVDLNATHVALGNLKRTALLHLPDYEDFHRFFANAAHEDNVAAYFMHIAPYLDASSRRYWESRTLSGRRRIALFTKGVYQHGLLGRFIGLAHLLARLHGENPRNALKADTLAGQRAYFEEKLLPLFDKPLIRWLTGQPASLFGLGIPPAQYEKLAGGQDMATVLRARLEKLVCDFDFSDNYFAWQAFSRGYEEAPDASLPPYLQREQYDRLRQRADRLDVRQANMTEYLAGQDAQSVDRFVLLDAQDWMTDQQLDALWNQISRTARKGARVLFRTAAEPSLLPGRLRDDLLALWEYQEARSLELTRRDRSSIYGGTHLYIKKA